MADSRIMNTKLLRRVQKAILAHPDQFEMWLLFQPTLYFNHDPLALYTMPAGGCGTAACIGGWAIHLAGKHKTLKQSAGAGYAKAKTPLARAKSAAARIDHFIKTKGGE